MKTIRLPGGERVPALGQGTWKLGHDASTRAAEIAALQRGIDLGLTLIDTAEMYGDGAAESLVGAAIAGRRSDVFVVTKVLPSHASRDAMRRSCDASLKRLAIDAIDLYLLHWPGRVPLAETVDGFVALQRAGKIRHWGVSNFDTAAMQSLVTTPGGDGCATDQVLYHLGARGTEWDLQPWLREHRMPLMAYSPFDEGRLLRSRGLVAFAREHGRTPAQVALAWLLARDGVVAIPKSARRAAVEENARAAAEPLTDAELRALDALFPPPAGASPLAVI